MPLTARGRRAAQVRDDEASLAHIQSRLQRLQQERAAADAWLAEAKRVAEDLDRETRELQDVEQIMAAKLASSRAALVQECVSTLPDDVLRCIFTEVVSDGAARAPFTVAAVCSRWRRVALDYAVLWSIIHITFGGLFLDLHTTLSTEYDRATILLSRSRSSPLDIRTPNLIRQDDEMLRLLRRIFNLLGAHVSRWKFATLRLPPGIGSSPLDFLRGPTPVLVDLIITSTGPLTVDFGPSQSGYLPFAPRLQGLSIDYAGIGCSTRHSFPEMKSLSFFSGACTDDDVFMFLRLSGQSLRKLVLWKALTRGPPTTIHLLKLEYLCITLASTVIASTPAPSIVTPALAHLELYNIPAANVTDSILPFLDAISPTVTKLTVSRSLSAASILILARLRNLEQISFDFAASFTSVEALELLTTNTPPIWPRLTHLLNLPHRLDSHTLSEALLRFISSRNLPEEHGDPGVARACKLREVTFHGSTPQWFVAEVERVLKL